MNGPKLFEAADRVIEGHRHKKARLMILEQELRSKKEQRDALVPQISLFEEVRVFLQELAEVTRNEIMAGLEHVVTLCLQAVFGPHLRFEIEVETIRNNTGVSFYVVNEAGEHIVRLKPEDNMGGGVIDTISIGLRFGMLKILNPQPIGPIFLDEPAKMVSADKIDSIGSLLKQLSQMFEKQIIMVTHHDKLMDIMDHAVHVRNENGRTICE